jgi:DeoR family transcriptional regulator, ulaG and ulaABCDEF operon transcriptional repressor
LRRCKQLVVLADGRKLRQRSSIVVGGLEQVSILITDAGAADKDLEIFRSAGVRVLQAPFDPSDRHAETG